MSVPESVTIPAPSLSDATSRSALQSTVRSLIALVGRPRVVVNLAEVTTIDADGVATLLACWKACREAGGQLSLTDASVPLRVLLQLCRLHLVFPEVAGVPAAPGRAPRLSRRPRPLAAIA